MSENKRIAILFLALAVLLVSGCNFKKPESKNMSSMPTSSVNKSITGNDQDEHGCIGSAGYVWCENTQRCIRIWEENCYDNTKAQIQFLISNRHGIPTQDVSITIQQSTDSYVRGVYEVIPTAEEKFFLAAKDKSIWVLVFDGSSSFNESQIEQYNFPSEMIRGIK